MGRLRRSPSPAFVLLVALAAASGCMDGAPPEPTPIASETVSSSTTLSSTPSEPPPDPDDVVVDGVLWRQEGWFLVNVTAHNTGGHTYGYDQGSCLPSTWHARLSGPPGQNLSYSDPTGPSVGCPGHRLGRLEPGAWLNWTAHPQCNYSHYCGNKWDGRLWNGTTASPAPPGRYTWEFVFPYYDEPGRSENGTFTPPSGPRSKSLAFQVDWG